jgi:hypothetical protein
VSPRKQRMSPEDAQKAASHAQQNLPCGDCGAAPGMPCTEPGKGKTVHQGRFVAAAIAIRRQAKAERRTPEQAVELAAVLARLPRLTPEEVEARPAASPASSSQRGACRGRRQQDGCRPCCGMRTAPMPANPAAISVARAADRKRIQDRVRELADLARLMRQPGTLAEPDEPVPLHRTNRKATERTRP